MEFLIMFLAFFFALLMCLGLILMKWVISQLGATIFIAVLFMVLAAFLLSVGDWNHDDEQ